MYYFGFVQTDYSRLGPGTRIVDKRLPGMFIYREKIATIFDPNVDGIVRLNRMNRLRFTTLVFASCALFSSHHSMLVVRGVFCMSRPQELASS